MISSFKEFISENTINLVDVDSNQQDDLEMIKKKEQQIMNLISGRIDKAIEVLTELESLTKEHLKLNSKPIEKILSDISVFKTEIEKISLS